MAEFWASAGAIWRDMLFAEALVYSFYPSDYDSTITYLQNALEHISSWMTANLLTLNFSVTPLKQNFSSLVTDNNLLEYRTLLLIPLTVLAIWALSLTNISLSLTKSPHCLNLVILTFVNFVVFVLISILKQLVPSPPTLFS